MTDHQLDIWAGIIYEEMDKFSEVMDETYGVNMTRYSYAKGMRDGFVSSMTWLSTVEDGKRFKDRIAKIDAKLQ